MFSTKFLNLYKSFFINKFSGQNWEVQRSKSFLCDLFNRFSLFSAAEDLKQLNISQIIKNIAKKRNTFNFKKSTFTSNANSTTVKNKYSKYFIFSAVGTYMFDSNTDRLALGIIHQFLNEVDLIEKLLTDSNSCKSCKSRIPKRKRKFYDNDKDDENEKDVECSCTSKVVELFKESDITWEPYLSREKENIVVWRKEQSPAMYAYKVYAAYDDITPNDFLQVQTDLEYRKQWDETVAVLEMIETDHFNDRSIIYWETKWPRLFANRDYVFDRKIYTDQKKKWIVISNKSSLHEKCPVYPNKHRVKDYWSYMIIKPKTTFYEPGLEYILIYYDDPGLAIPSTVTAWVAQTQMPDFLYKLYKATLKYAEKKQKSMKPMVVE